MTRAVGILAALAGGVALFIGMLITAPAPALGPLARAQISQTGVTNPVTAVLLDYRSYDTLLELLVVVLAVIGALALAPPADQPAPLRGPVAAGAAGVLAPAIMVLGGFVLWIGASAPGGAFQAAALIAGGLILLETVGHGVRVAPHGAEQARLCALSTVGVAVFAAAGAGAAIWGAGPLDWPTPVAGAIILGIEVAATAGLSLGLLALFRAGAIDVAGAGAMTGGALLYIALAAALFGLGLGGALLHRDPLRRLLAINVMGLGVFTALVTRPDDGGADPVAQALVITGLVVAVAATAVGLALIRRGQDGGDA